MGEKNLKQKQLADKIGTTQQAISRYLKNERTPDINLLCNIAKQFHVSTDYLLGLTDDPTPYWVSDTTYTSAEPAPNVFAYARGGMEVISAYVSPEDQKAAYDEAVRRRNENRKKKDPKE